MDAIQRSEVQTALAKTLKGVDVATVPTITKLADVIYKMSDEDITALIAQAKAVNAIYPADITEADKAGIQRAYLSIFDNKPGIADEIRARLSAKLGVAIP